MKDCREARKRDILRGALLLPLAGLLMSCGSGDSVTHDPATILQKIRAAYATTPDLTIEGSMKASGAPATVTFTAYVRGYDSLKMTLNGPFGIAVGGLAATPERFLFVSALEGVVYRGRPDRRTFGEAVRVSLDYAELVALIRSEIPRFPKPAELAGGAVETTQEGGLLGYRMTRGDTVETIVVDPEKLVIVSYLQGLLRNGTTDELLSVTYDDFFLKIGERSFPEKAVMKVDNGAMTVRVTFDRFRGEIPAGTRMSIELPEGLDVRDL